MIGLSIGVLAEDETDCDTIDVLVRRTLKDVFAAPVKIKKHWGKGCARLRRMAAAKMNAMAHDGCQAAILVHDLDRDCNNNMLNDEATLRAELSQIDVPSGLERLICIPVEELEAWFWCDPVIVQAVGRGTGKADPSPHLISKPKEKLQKLSRGANKRPRYSTNDNSELAKGLNLALCAQRCPAFREMADFVRRLAQSSMQSTELGG
jgi:hypothetical protein